MLSLYSYEEYGRENKRFSPLMSVSWLMRRQNSQKQRTQLRPYLEEGAVGNKFRWSALGALVLFFAIIGGWIYTALPMFINTGSFYAGKQVASVSDTLVIGAPPTEGGISAARVDTEPLQPEGAIIGRVPEVTRTPADNVPLGEDAPCVVYVKVCKVETVLAARAETGCDALCEQGN